MRRLREDGIPSIRAIAFGEELQRRREVRSAILTDAVPGWSLETIWGEYLKLKYTTKTINEEKRAVTSNDNYLKTNLILCNYECHNLTNYLVSHESFLRLIRLSARLVARFHGKGYAHRDLYVSHLYFDPTLPDAECLHLIDVQRLMCPRWRRLRWIVKDLAALHASTPAEALRSPDRLRWLKRYLGVEKLNLPAKRLAYRVIGKAARITARDRRRRRRGNEDR
jgi:hypothetical protein